MACQIIWWLWCNTYTAWETSSLFWKPIPYMFLMGKYNSVRHAVDFVSLANCLKKISMKKNLFKMKRNVMNWRTVSPINFEISKNCLASIRKYFLSSLVQIINGFWVYQSWKVKSWSVNMINAAINSYITGVSSCNMYSTNHRLVHLQYNLLWLNPYSYIFLKFQNQYYMFWLRRFLLHFLTILKFPLMACSFCGFDLFCR